MKAMDHPGRPKPLSRTRDAYVRARFPDVIVAASDLRDPGVVIDGARRCFGGGSVDRAFELLEIATDEQPECEALWLARLELLFFAGAHARFMDVVRDFLEVHPDSPQFGEIVQFWTRLPRA